MHHADTGKSQSGPHGPGVRIHPPLTYAGSILGGIGIDRMWPLPMPLGLHGPLYAGAIIALVMMLAGLCLYEFHQADTDVRPDRPDNALITTGPYCYSRNPLYIGLTLIQVAAAIGLDNAWVLAMSVLSVLVITRYAIRREERYLEHLFGPAYLDYKQRVRRWI
jgi:protein-S-isoprenylcysteine O-methyltransferase Ste14